MTTKYNIGDKVYIVGEIIEIRVNEKGMRYTIEIIDESENNYHECRIHLSENNEDLVSIDK